MEEEREEDDDDDDNDGDNSKGPNKSITTGTLKGCGRGRCRGVALPQMELTSHTF